MEFKAFKAQASRRDVIKGALKGAAYAAPIIVASSIPMAVGAATGPGGQTLFVNGVNNPTVPFSTGTITFTGRGYGNVRPVYRIIFRTGNASQFSFIALTPGGDGSITNTITPSTNILIAFFGPGSYTVVTTYDDPGAGGVAGIRNVLVSNTFNVTAASFAPTGTLPPGGTRE